MRSPSHSLNHVYAWIRAQLASLSLPQAQVQAEADLLLEHFAGYSPQDRYLNPNQVLPEQILKELGLSLQQRIHTRIPIQYLVGAAYFYGKRWLVSPAVLIPRPETEILVELAARSCPPSDKPLAILDLGTGSGIIAITLKILLGDRAFVTAGDLSQASLDVAQRNAALHGADIDFRHGDLFAVCQPGEQFDLIVSNPPYIDPTLASTLAPEVLQHEPAMALFPNDGDAYCFYRRIAEEAGPHLQPGGSLWLETGDEMGEKCAEIFHQAGYQDVRIHPDYAGRTRVLEARRAPANSPGEILKRI